MKPGRSFSALACAAALLLATAGCRPEALSAQAAPLVHRIDHIAVVVPSPDAVDDLLTLFRDGLGLPQWFAPGIRADASRPAWSFYNTGVYLGNLFLEFITFDPAAPPDRESVSARYFGFAFESGVDDLAAELDGRGVPRSRFSRFAMRNPVGGTDTLFTNVRVLDLSSRSIYVFFSRSHPPLFGSPHFPGYPRVPDNRAQHEHFARVAADSPDSLGIVRVREVVVSAPDSAGFGEGYSKLFSPARRSEGGRWQPPAGPALRLVPGEEHMVERLVVEVASLERARRHLERSGLLAATRADSLLLRPERVGGIEIAFVASETAGIPDIREHDLRSEHVDEEYRILVGLPDGYSDSGLAYPVLYVLDAEKSFGLARDVADWLAWAGEIPPLIVVGISYGEDRDAWWEKRSRDLTPWPDRSKVWGEWPLAGGAEPFRSFLRAELFPLIEGKYRTTEDRALVGLSFGGLFGAYDLLTDAPLFQRYILVSPALVWDHERIFRMEADRAASRDDLPASVYSAIGALDDATVTEPWRKWNERVRSRSYTGLLYIPEEFDRETHVSVFPAAVTRGLKAVY